MKERSVSRLVLLTTLALFSLSFVACSSSSDDDDDAPSYRMKERRSYDEEGALIGTYHYVYDSEGKYDGNHYTNADGVTVTTQRYEYDSPYGYTKSYSYDKDGNLSSYTVVTFNSNGQSVKQEQYDATDTVTGTATFTYDADGKKTRMDYVYPEGSGLEDYSYYTQYEYDANGNRTQSVTYVDGVPTSSSIYSYENGLWSRMDHYYDGDLSGHSEFAWEEASSVDNQVSTYWSLR